MSGSSQENRMAYNSRIPAEQDYLLAIGQLAYSYCYLEWQVISLIHKLDRDFPIQSASTLAGGAIAGLFKKAVHTAKEGLSESAFARLRSAYTRLFKVVEMRNDLFHAHPFTSEGSQRLGRYKDGRLDEWTAASIEDANKEIDDLAVELNKIYYTVLA